MDIKLIEIRDAATFIPAMAIRLQTQREREVWLLRRAGYAAESIAPYTGAHGGTRPEPYVILCKLDGVEAHYDPFDWPGFGGYPNRTMRVIHHHLIEHWHDVRTGDVLDVEFLLGEVEQPKVSEQLTEVR